MLERCSVKELDGNVFTMIGEQWMLVTAGTPEKCNTMTASWGGLGVLWGTDVATCYVRPQRYTFGFMEESDWFTLSFLGGAYLEQLKLCGTRSGRDMDKISACGFTVAAGAGDAPYIGEADLVLVCRKLYAQDFDPERFVRRELLDKWYPAQDYSRMYIGEIVEAYRKK